MKLNIKTTYILFLAAFVFTLGSCEDMLNTGSDRLSFEKEHELDSPNDSIYSLMGILSQLQKIGDRYIIFGELRGDLMNVTENATTSLKEIATFNPSSDNPYIDKRDYYNIINNCNYVITHMDTAITIRQEKVMMPEYVAIKTIRAWTYWQLAQIFGSVSYFEKPIMSLDASLTQYPVVGIDELAETLIKDIYPYQTVRQIDYGNLENRKATSKMVIPVLMLLGDLYLYQNNYQEAASMYHKLMFNNNYVISAEYTNRYTNAAGDAYTGNHIASYAEEVISEIVFSNQIKYLSSNFTNITYSGKASLVPATNFVENMSSAKYLHAEIKDDGFTDILAYFEGDLRGTIKLSKEKSETGDAFQSFNIMSGKTNLITKYYNNSEVRGYSAENWDNELLTRPTYMTVIPLYRHPHLYLRYAEAINRVGKPSFAFAVLKYGLNATYIADSTKVNREEIKDLPSYMNFTDRRFSPNSSIASRGRGYGIYKDLNIYVIPKLETLQDSVNWVELRILDELAAETAFEGNRFFDLLCISRHRENHPAFMAEKVGERIDDAALKNKLKNNIDAWFFK